MNHHKCNTCHSVGKDYVVHCRRSLPPGNVANLSQFPTHFSSLVMIILMYSVTPFVLPLQKIQLCTGTFGFVFGCKDFRYPSGAQLPKQPLFHEDFMHRRSFLHFSETITMRQHDPLRRMRGGLTITISWLQSQVPDFYDIGEQQLISSYDNSYSSDCS